MYAIVDIAGQQFKVEKNQKIYVHQLEGNAGSKVDFDKVLLIENDQNVIVGAPVIEGAMVYASIVNHQKGDKVLVFKKKRKKGYRKLNGHRQSMTQILIEDIIEKDAKPRITEEKPKAVKTKKTTVEVIAPEKATTIPTASVKEKIEVEKPVAEEKKAASVASGKKTGKPAVKKVPEESVSEVKQASARKTKTVKKTASDEKPVKTSKPKATKKSGDKKSK